MNTKRKLIIHVGMEKTGTSSVQHTAKKNNDYLKSTGVYYLGLMLEEFPTPIFSWQNIRGWTAFSSEDKDKSNRELVHLFNEINDNLPDEYHTLIWSNESLFNSVNFLDIALNWLNDKFLVEIVGYIRKPDAWIQSAYLQWGVKHKSYSGPLKSFNEWVEDKHFPVIDFVNKWNLTAKNSFFYNFDGISNISEHFFTDYLGCEKENIELIRINETPSPAQLALFTLYNSSFVGEVLPYRIENLFAKNAIPSDTNNLKELSNLTPTQTDLDDYCQSTLSNISVLQRLLVNSLDSNKKVDEHNELKSLKYDQNSINLELLKLCISLNERVNELENKNS